MSACLRQQMCPIGLEIGQFMLGSSFNSPNQSQKDFRASLSLQIKILPIVGQTSTHSSANVRPVFSIFHPFPPNMFANVRQCSPMFDPLVRQVSPMLDHFFNAEPKSSKKNGNLIPTKNASYRFRNRPIHVEEVLRIPLTNPRRISEHL